MTNIMLIRKLKPVAVKYNNGATKVKQQTVFFKVETGKEKYTNDFSVKVNKVLNKICLENWKVDKLQYSKEEIEKMYDELENRDYSRENIDLDDWLYLKYSFLENIKKYAKKSR